MRAVVYRGVNDLRLETVPVPRIGANELLVKVAVCGVCPTDIKKIQHGTVPPPRIFGHETAGIIVKIGGNRTSLEISSPGETPPSPPLRAGERDGVRGRSWAVVRVGDRVALHHHVPCLKCHFCRHRAFAQCETYKRTGITAGFEPAGGGYAEYVRVMPFVLPGVVKIPAKNSFAEGAMLEPVNTILKAVRRLNLLPGDAALVAGQGPIGLMFTKILQLQGIRVLATDLLPSRLELARKFGAKWTANPRLGRAELLLRRNARQRVPTVLDAAIIAVPSDAAVQQALQLVRGGGQVLLFAHTKRSGRAELLLRQDARQRVPATFSLQPSAFSLDLASICLDEKDLIGSYSSDFTLQAEVARLVFSRRLDVRPLITHRFPLEQTAAAVSLAASPTPESLKILVAAGASPL
jgi:L-iditol 2-dehydrogenase